MPNPLRTPSTLPFRLPAFAAIRPEHFRDAFDTAMAAQRAEVADIATNPEPPTFANTIVALEATGTALASAERVFWNQVSADTSPELDALDAEYAPQLAAHHDAVELDPRLFARIDALFQQRDTLALAPDERTLLERRHRRARLHGAALTTADRLRLVALNAEIASLETRFDQALLADTNDLALHLTDPSDLDGLDDGAIRTARVAAEARGLEGWILTLTQPTMQPALASLTRAEVRDLLLAASLARGSRGNAHDTRETLLHLVRLRAQRAELLGFRSHADAVLADETAKTPEAVAGFIRSLVPRVRAAVARERADIAACAEVRGERSPRAADWPFLAERIRAERFDTDYPALRQYFDLDQVVWDGVFHAARLLYGLQFLERHDLAGFTADTRVFEVREADETPIGLYLLDPYARDSKRGGAWMLSLVEQSELSGELPVVVNSLNVPKPAPNDRTLLTFDETESLFHEFGHALHGLLARVRFPSQSGTNVVRDFVEMPSQVNELWMLHPEILRQYAIHAITGNPLGTDAVARIRAGRNANQGYTTAEYLASAWLDLAWHRLSAAEAAAITDPAAFEQAALEAIGLDDPLIPPRYFSAYFAHIFTGGYDAGYYGYLWSEVPGADIMAWFEEHGGARAENGERFRRQVLEPGGSRSPAECIREVLGRDPDVGALLRWRGLE